MDTAIGHGAAAPHHDTARARILRPPKHDGDWQADASGIAPQDHTGDADLIEA
jgi:hypothetical protein